MEQEDERLEAVAKRLDSARLRVELAQSFRLEVERDIQTGLIPPQNAREARQRAVYGEWFAAEQFQRAVNTYNFLSRNRNHGQDTGRNEDSADSTPHPEA